jgi:hypothetical protein
MLQTYNGARESETNDVVLVLIFYGLFLVSPSVSSPSPVLPSFVHPV